MGRESKVRHCRKSHVWDVETGNPGRVIFVLEFELEVVFLEVRQAEFGGGGATADAARRAAGRFLVFAVVAMVVGGVAVAWWVSGIRSYRSSFISGWEGYQA